MTELTKMVIPVAGLGTRVLPASKVIPKEMLTVVDKPVIQYVIEEAVAAGFREIILVTRPSKRSIEAHFEPHPELEAALNYADGSRGGRPPFDLKGKSLLAAARLVQQQPVPAPSATDRRHRPAGRFQPGSGHSGFPPDSHPTGYERPDR